MFQWVLGSGLLTRSTIIPANGTTDSTTAKPATASPAPQPTLTAEEIITLTADEITPSEHF